MADIQQYLDLITSQYQVKPKFSSWLTAHLNIIDGITTLANDLFTYFDLDHAEGVQLDTVGGLIGVKRRVNFIPTGNASPVLNDDDYRMFLKASIVRNIWDGTLPSLYSGWYSIFKDIYLIIHDNQNMQTDVLIIGDLTQMQKDLITNDLIVPRPDGVLYTYSYSTNPFFSYDLETDHFKGYDEGYWPSF